MMVKPKTTTGLVKSETFVGATLWNPLRPEPAACFNTMQLRDKAFAILNQSWGPTTYDQHQTDAWAGSGDITVLERRKRFIRHHHATLESGTQRYVGFREVACWPLQLFIYRAATSARPSGDLLVTTGVPPSSS